MLSSRMQYRGTSSSEMLTSLLGGIVRTRVRLPEIAGFAPAPASFCYAPEESILERMILPLFHVAGICFAFCRRLQHGRLHIYMSYIFATLLLLMLWVR
jgi:hydrogenase-4 component B